MSAKPVVVGDALKKRDARRKDKDLETSVILMDTSPVLTAGSHVTGALLYSFAYDAKESQE